jgi:4'-phosphopantetheinyl transferase
MSALGPNEILVGPHGVQTIVLLNDENVSEKINGTTPERGRSWPWPARTDPPRLREEEVHVWHADLGSMTGSDADLMSLLSDDERARAGRFVFERHRRRFTAARGRLRRLLSSYLEIAPEAVAFQGGRNGKPHLAPTPTQDTRLRFNVSHSEEQALFAVALEREVGVDIEHVDPAVRVLELAGRFFAPEEAAVLRALPPEARHPAFFRLWTLKEALLKASGAGLSGPLDTVVLRPDADGDGPLVLEQETGTWSLQELRPPPGFAAAVTVAGRGSTLCCWSLGP